MIITSKARCPKCGSKNLVLRERCDMHDHPFHFISVYECRLCRARTFCPDNNATNPRSGGTPCEPASAWDSPETAERIVEALAGWRED